MFSPPFEKSEKPTSETFTPAYSPFKTTFATVSLHRSDRIRLLAFPHEDVAAIRGVIKAYWRKGIQEEQTYGPSFEFKLHGYPWQGQTSDAITSRILMREILAHLFKHGWTLHASTDVSKKEMDKDTLFFRKQQSPPPESEWISISFNQFDRLRLIGANAELISAMKQVLASMNLLQEDRGWKDKELIAWEFKIRGNPWCATGVETMTTRLLLMRILECLESHGWSLYASIDQNTGGQHTSECDSWFCVRDKAWVEGMAVFHR
jgi:hypothetical protein